MGNKEMKIAKKILIEQQKYSLHQTFEMTLDERVNRYLDINHEGIIPNTPFSPASSECIKLYRDGYLIATVMMSHAINEGIVKYVAERNGLRKNSSF